MKVTQYRYKKEQLLVKIRNLEAMIDALHSDSMAEQIATVRNKLCFTLPGYNNEWAGKLPVIVWGATYRK